MKNKPLENSYSVADNIFAGEYPGDKNEETANAKISRMVDFGIRHFIDLTEENELRPYSHLLPQGVTYRRFPIRDCNVPENMEDVEELLDYIQDLSMEDNGYVYIHCWGGVGRTGTIVGCYIAGDSFVMTMYDLRSRFSEMPKSAYRVTPENKAQEEFIEKFIEFKHNEQREWISDCIRGSLMAGAAGDALGYTVEFMRLNDILKCYGKNGINEFELDRNGKALISDDTQMTLFTANGILMGVTRVAMRGIGGGPENYVYGAYIDWYYTQTGRKENNTNDFHFTWLRDLPELAHRRAPGNTCLDACESLLTHREVKNNSKGCGGLMRVAPLGLLAASAKKMGNLYSDSLSLAAAGAKIAEVTHRHPLGYLPAALMTLLLYGIVPLSPGKVKRYIKKIIKDSIGVMMRVGGEENIKTKETLKNITMSAVRLAESNIPDSDAIRILGEGWVAEEAWAISLFCALRHIDSVKDAIIAAVNHDGDSDSTGSITGNIMGAIYGYESIRKERLFCPVGKSFEDVLELHDIILTLADDLSSGCPINEYSPVVTRQQRQWYLRYCEMLPAGLKQEYD